MKYFRNIITAEEIKKQFRAYCVSMHPDKGGDPEEFKSMMAEYQAAMKNAGAWTKDEEKEAEGIRRGSVIVCIWGPSGETKYIVLSVHGEDIKTVRLFGQDFQSLEDIDYIMSDEYETKESFRTFRKYDRIERLSKKYGCGLYWDDVTNKTYTEREIANLERIAGNFDTWAQNWEADKKEKERIAQEKADREEAAIIAQWSGILEELPPMFKGKTGAEWCNLSREERKAQEKAERSANAKRLAAFKRNIKAVFNHFWPGVKVTVSDNQKYFDGSKITWEDGPLVEEVKTCEVFYYFTSKYYESDPYADYGHYVYKKYMCRFRELFGSFSDSSIVFKRNFSKDSLIKVRQVIAENFPQAEERRAAHEKDEKENLNFVFTTEGMNTDAQKLKKICGFVYPKPEDFDDTEAGRAAYYEASSKYQYFSSEILNCTRYDGKMNYNILLEFLRERYKLEDAQQKKQTGKKEKADRSEKAAKSEKAAEDIDMTAAPAEGLELVEIAEGVAVVGDQRTTYKNRKQIKAHGARWNKDAQQWQATTAEAVASLREWFGITEKSEAETAQDDAQQGETSKTVEDTEDVAAERQSATDEPGANEETAAEETAADAETCEQVEAVGVLASALSFLVGAIVSATEKANEALKKAAAEAAEATAKFEAEHREEERKEAAAILREQIKKVSEQVASLSDTLAQMQERLNALESGQGVSEKATEEPQPDTTAQNEALAQQDEATAQSRPKGGSGSGVDLSMLQEAAKDVQRLTWESEYIKAALAELYALCACGVSVVDLIDETKALAGTREPLGVVGLRCASIRHIAENRAKAIINIDVLHALFSLHDTKPGSDEAA